MTKWNYTLGLVIDYVAAVFFRRDSLQYHMYSKRRLRVRGRLCNLTRYFLPIRKYGTVSYLLFLLLINVEQSDHDT